MQAIQKQDFAHAITILTHAFLHNKTVLTVAQNPTKIPNLMRYCLVDSYLQNLAFTNTEKTGFALCTFPLSKKIGISQLWNHI